MKQLVVIAFALAWASASQAETVYRCGDGHAYSQQPCPAAQAVQVDDTRTAAQRQQAEDVARSEARRAEQLERERHARESAPGANAIGIGSSAPHPASAASSAAHKKSSHPHDSHHRKKKTKKQTPFDDDGGTLTPPVRVPGASAPRG